MCEIRPEAHIKCKAVAEANLRPGVEAMIWEPMTREWDDISGTATMSRSGNNMIFTIPTSKVPRLLVFYGRLSESYISGTTSYYQVSAFGYHCEMQDKKIKGVFARMLRSRTESSSSYNYSYNTYDVLEKDFEYAQNDDGTIEIIIPLSGTYLSYLRNDVNVRYYAYE